MLTSLPKRKRRPWTAVAAAASISGCCKKALKSAALNETSPRPEGTSRSSIAALPRELWKDRPGSVRYAKIR